MKKRKRWIWIVVAAGVVLAAVWGYLIYTRFFTPSEAEEEPVLQTATVTQGDIVLSALGSGTLLPARELDLAFNTSGPVTEVLVEVGDEVHAGDVLARLGTTDLERALTQAEISLRQAQISLETAQEPPDEATLRQYQYSVSQAAASLEETQLSLETVEGSAVLNEDLQTAQYRLQDAQANYAHTLAQYEAGEVSDAWMDRVTQALVAAQRNLERTQQDGTAQLESARNAVTRAAQSYQQAVDDLAAAQAGSDALSLESLQLKVQLAEMDLAVAQENLDNATLVAPFDGIVTAVNAVVGEEIGGSAAAVTLADMHTPLMEFWVEEADMASAVVGNPVSIVFDALPDLTYSGQIVRVEPTLVDMGGTTAVQIWASVDTSTHPDRLFAGMNAEVEVTYGQALGALLVPVEALRELTPGQYAVFVIGADGEMELRPVTVGLQDYVNVEILSGLQFGEVVSAGVEDTSLTASPAVDVSSPQFPGGGFFIQGGGPP